MINGTITRIQPGKSKKYFTATGTNNEGKTTEYTAKKIILATGLRDLIPDTPGLKENWAKGICICEFCDGYEHANQTLGVIAPLERVPRLVRSVLTLNRDIIAFTNGTDTPEARLEMEEKEPNWKVYLKIHNVSLDNRKITSIERLRDGSDPNADSSLPSHPEDDLFRINLNPDRPVERNVLMISVPVEQTSWLGMEAGVRLVNGLLQANASDGFATNIPGIYAVGDANTDGISNVPHALFSGKQAAMHIHGKLFLAYALGEEANTP